MPTILLMRHGQALDPAIDPERGLSETGRADAAGVADRLAAAGVTVDLVHHSGKKRALETAAILAGRIGRDASITRKPGLEPNDDIEGITRELEKTDLPVAVVGHLPFMQILLARLTGNAGDRLFGTATAIHLERNGADWSLVNRYDRAR